MVKIFTFPPLFTVKYLQNLSLFPLSVILASFRSSRRAECTVKHCFICHYTLVFLLESFHSVFLCLRLDVSKLSHSCEQNLLTTWSDPGVLLAGWHWLAANRLKHSRTVSLIFEIHAAHLVLTVLIFGCKVTERDVFRVIKLSEKSSGKSLTKSIYTYTV